MKIRQALDDRFDEHFGVDTAGKIEASEMAVVGANKTHGKNYQAVFPDPFFAAIKQLPVDFEKSVFVDFGSGKGRAVLLASEFPFKKIVGVEYSPELHRIAEANCQKYLSPTQKCKTIELLCLDAVAYTIPAEPTVFYIWNSFDEAVMTQVADNIRRSLQDAPRQVFVVCFWPKDRGVWDRLSTLEGYPIREPAWPVFLFSTRKQKKQVVAVWTSKGNS